MSSEPSNRFIIPIDNRITIIINIAIAEPKFQSPIVVYCCSIKLPRSIYWPPPSNLEITNVDDSSKKYSWVSTNTPHAIYLENGKYKLCETIAPKGYTLKTECINFTVDGKKIISVTMENDTTITPPNTGMFSSKSIYIIGGLLIVIGFSTIVIIYNKKQRLS